MGETSAYKGEKAEIYDKSIQGNLEVQQAATDQADEPLHLPSGEALEARRQPSTSRQVVAVAGFLALGFAFYIFFLPFVEYSILETGGLVAYSLTILVVCTLYTWCVTSNLAVVQLTSLKNVAYLGTALKRLCNVPMDSITVAGLGFLFSSVDLWLNNCIGKRNYKAFVILIVAALIMFTLQWKLGRSFPPLGYLLVLVSCTVLAMVATCVLVKLIFFHALLIKKGLTTYEYSLAKRNEENQQQQSVGPMSFDAEQQGELFSEKDLSGSWRTLSQRFTTRKTAVKINPWNLSFGYEGEDALQDLTSMPKLSAGHPVAPAKVLKSSFDSGQGFSAELEASYEMGSASRRFSGGHSGHIDEILCSWQNGKLPVDSFEQLDSSENDSGTLSHPVVKDNTLAPLQREARSVFTSSHSFCSGVSVPTPGAA
ncbi:hypothetical protein L7F22_050078 [Adiantum nelumboides]|nr:hypothetical protein [Adiantum nelumboides]